MMALGVLAVCFAVLVVGASSASAALVRLPSGKIISYEPLGGPKAPKVAPVPTGLAASPFDNTFGNLDYNGGPVMSSNTNYTIVWNPSNYTKTPFQTGYVGGVNQFLTDVAHESGLHTNSDSVSTQYNDSAGQVAAYNSTYGGSFTDTDPLPANGCPALTGDICLTDAQLQTELDSFLSSNTLPADVTHEYFLLTPPSIASCFDSTAAACSANGDSSETVSFCAYHSSTAGSYVYSNIPDLVGVNGCDPYATVCPSAACDYPNSPADAMLSAISHEHNESITDPQPDSGWIELTDASGGEIGDKCNFDAYLDPNTNDNAQPDGNDAPFNETINGRGYWIQEEWSNQTHSCLDHFTASATVAHASFTESAGAGNAVNFTAGSSTATGGVFEYVWQFNDGSAAVETTSPTLSHTFPFASTFSVALTVMTSDGTSNGTQQNVAVPVTTVTPAITGISPTSGTTAGGTTVTINGSGFTGATRVAFGGVAATSFNVVSSTQITAVSPAQTGAHYIVVTGPGGTSPTVSAAIYTYH